MNKLTKRITIGIDEETYKILADYSDVLGQTLSGTVSDMVFDRREKMKIIVQKSQELDRLVNGTD